VVISRSDMRRSWFKNELDKKKWGLYDEYNPTFSLYHVWKTYLLENKIPKVKETTVTKPKKGQKGKKVKKVNYVTITKEHCKKFDEVAQFYQRYATTKQQQKMATQQKIIGGLDIAETVLDTVTAVGSMVGTALAGPIGSSAVQLGGTAAKLPLKVTKMIVNAVFERKISSRAKKAGWAIAIRHSLRDMTSTTIDEDSKKDFEVKLKERELSKINIIDTYPLVSDDDICKERMLGILKLLIETFQSMNPHLSETEKAIMTLSRFYDARFDYEGAYVQEDEFQKAVLPKNYSVASMVYYHPFRHL